MKVRFEPDVEIATLCVRALAGLPAGLGEALHGKTILATGCSGFFGVWTVAVVEELRRAGVSLDLLVVSRDPERFLALHPGWRSAPWLRWIRAEPSRAGLERADPFDFVLHMAARSDAGVNARDPAGMMISTLSWTAATAQVARAAGAPMLMVSSGAVYGRREADLGPVREIDDRSSAPDPLDPRQAYGEAKRACEMTVACVDGLEWTVARPFAFLGPFLPLDAHFAAGNFLRDAASGRAIQIKGDGTPLRSLMHPADLAAWQLWLMALGPRSQAFNVGSSEAVSLGGLAREISKIAQAPEPEVLGIPGSLKESYVPDAGKARALGLKITLDRAESIERSVAWLRAAGGSWGWA